jgi:hypothetical protein
VIQYSSSSDPIPRRPMAFSIPQSTRECTQFDVHSLIGDSTLKYKTNERVQNFQQNPTPSRMERHGHLQTNTTPSYTVLGSGSEPSESLNVDPDSAKNKSTQKKSRRRPPYSYIALIAMSIQQSSEKRLTLDGICKFIRDKFPFYRETYPAWKICIRNNLSLNDCFVKTGIKSDEPLKGNYWTLDPESYNMFENGSFLRRKTRFKRQERVREEHASKSCLRETPGYPTSPLLYNDLNMRLNSNFVLPSCSGLNYIDTPKISTTMSNPYLPWPSPYISSPARDSSLQWPTSYSSFLPPYYNHLNSCTPCSCTVCDSSKNLYLRLSN